MMLSENEQYHRELINGPPITGLLSFIYSNVNKTGLQPVLRPVEQILGFYRKVFKWGSFSKKYVVHFSAKISSQILGKWLKHCHNFEKSTPGHTAQAGLKATQISPTLLLS